VDFPGLIGAYYTAFSSKAEIQSCKNLRLERIESGAGRNQFAMYRNHGLKLFSAALPAAGSMCRGFLELNDHLFDVQDDYIKDILSDGTYAASYGPILNDSLICSMAATMNSLFVVSNQTLYRVNAGALTTPATPEPVSAVAVLAGQAFALAAGTSRKIYFSRDDGATWAALDYQSVEAASNALITMIADHQELWVFGNRVTQVFQLGSDPDAPLVPISAGFIEMGISAARAVVALDNSLFWLGRNKDGDGGVWRANGYTPGRVSNNAVEAAFRSYGRYDDATMQAYQISASCFRLTFPSANNGLGVTWEYDATLPPELAWTEVAAWNYALNRYERHRGNCYISAFGKILVGDYANGFIYEMSPDFNSDYGYPIRWERRTPHITADRKRIQYKRLDLFMQVGVGSTDPVWINTHQMDLATFTASVAALQFIGEITAAQGVALLAMYNYLPFLPTTALPSSAIMTSLNFYDYAANPQVGMRYSNDGGNTWSATSYRDLGAAGEFNKRLYWQRLGSGFDRVWEISGDAAVKTAIVQGSFDAAVCDN
jgi:hypothetical protein